MFARKLAKNSLEYHRRYSEYLIKNGSHEDLNLAYDHMNWPKILKNLRISI